MQQIQLGKLSKAGKSRMTTPIFKPTEDVQELAAELCSTLYQAKLPWNCYISLEKQARSYMPTKIDPRFFQQKMLEQATLLDCRMKCTLPKIAFIEGDTDLGKFISDRATQNIAYGKIINTPEMKMFRGLKKCSSLVNMLTCDSGQASAYSSAGVPYRYSKPSRMPVEAFCDALFRGHVSSWVAVRVHLPTVFEWHARTGLIPSLEGGLKSGHNENITNAVAENVKQVMSWYMDQMTKPVYGCFEDFTRLRIGNFNKLKYYVNFVYPGVTVATVPFWLECGEMLEYFAEFV